MISKHKENVKAILGALKEAINQLYSDTSASQIETRDSLESISEEIGALIDDIGVMREGLDIADDE